MIGGAQMSLPGLTANLSNVGGNALGYLGEEWVAQRLRAQGLAVVTCRTTRGGGDLKVINPVTGQVTRIEVKTARQHKDGKWRFLVWQAGNQDYRQADVIIACAVTRSGDVVPFVIPVAAITAKRSQIRITSNPRSYAGKWARFRRYGEPLNIT